MTLHGRVAPSIRDPGINYGSRSPTDPNSGVSAGDKRLRWWRSPDVTVPGNKLPSMGSTIRRGPHLGPKVDVS